MGSDARAPVDRSAAASPSGRTADSTNHMAARPPRRPIVPGSPERLGPSRLAIRITRLAAAFAAVLAAAVLVAWALDAYPNGVLLPTRANMKPVTAVGILGAAAALALVTVGNRRANRATVVAAAVPIVVGVVTLLENVSDLELGSDTILFGDALRAVGGEHPGRPALTTGGVLAAAGVAVLARRAGRQTVAQVLGIAVFLGGYVGIVGYIFGVEALFVVGEFPRMAANTAAVFAVLGVGIATACADVGLPALLRDRGAAGLLVRRILPLVAVIPLLTGLLAVQGARADLFDTPFGIAITVTASMGLILGVVWATAASLRRIDSQRAQALDELLALTDELEERVAARTAELSYQALHDALTGLPNRALLLDRIEHALERARRAQVKVGILFLDLDRFKVVNDSLGHRAGDRLLVGVARRLRSTLRPEDTVARLGGDEFVVLCEGIDDVSALTALAVRLNDALVAEPFVLDGERLSMHASIGIAWTGGPPGRAASADALLRNADVAMYAAKESGRNRYQLFDDQLHARAVRRLTIEGDVRSALDEGRLFPVYQPLVSIASGRVHGVEALARIRLPDGTVLTASEFISIAEDARLIGAVGEEMLAQACRAAAMAADGGSSDLTVSVNVSGHQLRDTHFVGTVERVLDEVPLDPQRLCLELTESVLMEAVGPASAVIGELRALGAKIAIDDFGTGYSSFAYVRQFPVDILKIDQSFVAGLNRNLEDEVIVAGVVRLGAALDIEVIAEGVETREQHDYLLRLGCPSAQGFYYGLPTPDFAVIDLTGERTEPSSA